MAASHPCSRRGFLSYPRFSYLRCCLSLLVYVLCSGWCGTRRRRRWLRTGSGGVQDGSVEVLRGSCPVEREDGLLVLVSLVRVVCLIMVPVSQAGQLVHGVETGVSRQSLVLVCLASMS